jgi:hypothetical protein
MSQIADNPNMIFFSGFGFLVPIAAGGGFLLAILGESWIKTQFGYRVPNSLVVTCMALLPFVGMLAVDWLLKKMGPTEKTVDAKTGAAVEVARMHTFMFLPVKWCAYIWLGLALACWIATMVK